MPIQLRTAVPCLVAGITTICLTSEVVGMFVVASLLMFALKASLKKFLLTPLAANLNKLDISDENRSREKVFQVENTPDWQDSNDFLVHP